MLIKGDLNLYFFFPLAAFSKPINIKYVTQNPKTTIMLKVDNVNHLTMRNVI